ncbi:624_t:CDS:2, partial [Gigaspora margarita]
MASQYSETASNTFSVGENEPQEYSETNETSGSNQSLAKCKYVSGKKQGDIWLYIDQEKTLTKKKVKHNQSEITIYFPKIEPLPEARVKSLNKAILKAWIMCNFSFETVENPFIIDLFQLAIPGYDLPSRDMLSGHFIDQKVLRIEKRIDNDLEKEEYLTLLVRQIVYNTYPSILNIRCATHAVNLLASDFTKLDPIKDIIFKYGLILNFFHNFHIAHGYYLEQLRFMKIKGGEIKSYCKTHWGTFFTTVDSIVKSKPVFNWILENHISVISNDTVFDLFENEDFYMKCCQISVILKPVKKLTNCLEAKTANLADIFIGLIKLAASINQ